MKPNQKREESPRSEKRETTVDDVNFDSKTNAQEDEGGGYARPRAKAGGVEMPGVERPNRGD